MRSNEYRTNDGMEDPVEYLKRGLADESKRDEEGKKLTKAGLARALGVANARVHEMLAGKRELKVSEIPAAEGYLQRPFFGSEYEDLQHRENAALVLWFLAHAGSVIHEASDELPDFNEVDFESVPKVWMAFADLFPKVVRHLSAGGDPSGLADFLAGALSSDDELHRLKPLLNQR